MITKKIIDKDFRILNKSCNSFTPPMDCGFGHNTEKIFNETSFFVQCQMMTLKFFIWKKEAKLFTNQLMNQWTT